MNNDIVVVTVKLLTTSECLTERWIDSAVLDNVRCIGCDVSTVWRNVVVILEGGEVSQMIV